MDKKKELGQFYTTNYKYILQNMYIPNNVKNIIEPFAGNCDLLKFFDNTKYNISCYDIDPKHNYITKQDTLMNPPIYTDKFIITNPPYLARNKSTNKQIFNKYDTNDLYKCFIKEICSNKCIGGIIIIPLNFLSSIRSSDIELRKLFLSVYNIVQINIFEEQVFSDTTYTVCAIFFVPSNNNNNININIYPSNKKLSVSLNDNNNYTIGGDIYLLQINNTYSISRLTKNNINKKYSNILLKCIDDNINNQIGLSISKTPYIDKTNNLTCRTYATLIIEPYIDDNKQLELVNKFNKFLSNYRNKYNSLFLTNYRESKDIARKRISFELAYNIIIHILENFNLY